MSHFLSSLKTSEGLFLRVLGINETVEGILGSVLSVNVINIKT